MMHKKLRFLILILLTFQLTNVFAQKLSDVQEGNLLVNNIKVDGKAGDWAVPLKALNKSTGLAYSIANDDKRLYIVMQTKDVNATRKIMMGGITFSINADGKKRTKESLSLTYPVVTRSSMRSAFGGGQRGTRGSFQTMTQEQRDSMQIAVGQKQLEGAKDIRVWGFKAVTDTLISIYNKYSIKAMAHLASDGTYTYEIGIPLELIPLDLTEGFGYNIKVNGLQMTGGGRGSFGGGGGNRGGGGGFGGGGGSRGGFDFQDLMTPTDFWGKYSLAK